MPWDPDANATYLRGLYEARYAGLALMLEPVGDPDDPSPGDVSAVDGNIQTWVDWHQRDYERRCELHRQVDDDTVPYVRIFTGTGFLANAFGCELHHYQGSPPAARPLLEDVDDFDKLLPASIESPGLARVLELAERLSEAMPGVPIGVPDLQSPFGIAAIIWNKEDFLVSLLEEPEAVDELVQRCERLFIEFVDAFLQRVPNVQMCHCPSMWVPPEYGVHLSEDEIGIIAPEQFERFALPSLIRLSQHYGGLWMHCCADADHQYDHFARIPNLRGLNRRFFHGPERCIEQFSDTALFSMGWTPDEQLLRMIEVAKPSSRFMFNLSGHKDMAEARARLLRLREAMPRIVSAASAS
jgi:hypothetical protein